MKFMSKLLTAVSFFLSLVISVAELSAASANIPDVWVTSGFKNIDKENFENIKNYSANDIKQSSHFFNFTAVLYREAGWTVSSFKPNINGISKIFLQCGILIKNIKIITVDSPYGSLDYKVTGTPVVSTEIMRNLSGVTKPIIFFIKDIYPFQNKMTVKGAAISDALVKSGHFEKDSPWINSLFISSYLNKDWMNSWGDERAATIAHELGHLFGLKHDDESKKNLMSTISHIGKPVNDHLTQNQCDLIKQSKLLGSE